MKKQTETPLYATLLYEVRKELKISWLEYVYLDMVYHLSKEGWCYKSLDNCAVDLGIDRSNVYRMRQRLLKKGLLKKNIKGHVKTSVMYAKCIRIDSKVVAKRTNSYAKRNYSVGETQPKNNNRTTLELSETERKQARQNIARLKQQFLSRKDFI